MRFIAESIDGKLGERLRRGVIKGSVLSVHREAAYLQAEKGNLIVLVLPGVGNGPEFISVAGPSSFRDGPAALRASEPFTTGKERLSIGEGRIIINLAGAVPWSASLAPTSAPCDVRRRCMDYAMRIVLSKMRESGRSPLLTRICGCPAAVEREEPEHPEGQLAERTLALTDALMRGHGNGIAKAGRALIGMGEGLTPSGDDVLVGLMGFLRGAGAAGERALRLISGEVEEQAGKTNLISAHFLRAATQGRFTERVRDLLEAIFSGMEKSVEDAARRLLQYGARSGADLMCGIVLGYNAVTGDRWTVTSEW